MMLKIITLITMICNQDTRWVNHDDDDSDREDTTPTNTNDDNDSDNEEEKKTRKHKRCRLVGTKVLTERHKAAESPTKRVGLPHSQWSDRGSLLRQQYHAASLFWRMRSSYITFLVHEFANDKSEWK